MTPLALILLGVVLVLLVFWLADGGRTPIRAEDVVIFLLRLIAEILDDL